MTGVDIETLSAVLDLVDDGVAILDADQSCRYVNPAGRRLLGLPLGEPPPARLRVPDLSAGATGLTGTEVVVPVGGSTVRAVVFRDRPAVHRQQQRLLAFARTSARVATAGSLQAALDALAEEVLAATDAVTCTVLMNDEATGGLSLIGAAGNPPGYLERVEQARARGAPLRTLAALGGHGPRVQRDLPALVHADDRFAPLTPLVGPGGWRTLVAAPLVVRDVELGVLTAFYIEGEDPVESEVAFLAAMADQAAVAVNTAKLFAELEDRAAVEERHRLARDLHDSVAQSTFSLGLHSRAVELAAARLDDRSAEVLGDRVAALHELAESTAAQLRSLLLHLRVDEPCGEGGLLATLRERFSRSVDAAGPRVVVEGPDRPLMLSAAAEEQLFRVVTEAVSNSVRHAAASRVLVRLAEDPVLEELTVRISDDGMGFDPTREQPGHIGLRSMRERVARLGGRLAVDSSTDGTIVRAAVPYRRRGGAAAMRAGLDADA